MRAVKARAIRRVIGDVIEHRAAYRGVKHEYNFERTLKAQQAKPVRERVRKASGNHTPARRDAFKHMNVMRPVRLIKQLQPRDFPFSSWTSNLGWEVRGPNELGTLPRTMLRLMALQAVAQRQGA